MTVTEDPPAVLRHVFPAVVTLGDRVYRSALAVITRNRILVYVTRAAPVLDAPYDPMLSTVPPATAPRFAATYVRLTDGTGLTVTGQRGCGCGNPLKGWQPWTPYRKAPS